MVDNGRIADYSRLTMPITRSAKKALRQSVRRRLQNLKRKEAYMRAAKDLKKAAVGAGGIAGNTKEMISRLYQALDKAAKTRAISTNKARRLKSRLTKLAAKSTAR